MEDGIEDHLDNLLERENSEGDEEECQTDNGEIKVEIGQNLLVSGRALKVRCGSLEVAMDGITENSPHN